MSEKIQKRLAEHRKSARKGVGGALLASIVIHIVIALVGGVWIVATYYKKDEPKFVAPPLPKIKIPPQTREHRVNLAAHQALAAKPTFQAKLVSLRPTAFALPDAPKVDIENLLTPDPSLIASPVITGLSGSIGAGTGFAQGGAGGQGLGKSINFMGIEASGTRVMLVFDVSASVVNKAESSGIPLSRIKQETLNLIDELPAESRFGIIQFVRNYKPFSAELLAATQPNRELARQWIENEWSESGMMSSGGKGVISPSPNGILPILKAVYELRPDVIFLLSDGSFQRTGGPSSNVSEDEIDDLFKKLNASPSGKIPLYFVGFKMRDEDEDFWSKTARRQGGSLKALE